MAAHSPGQGPDKTRIAPPPVVPDPVPLTPTPRLAPTWRKVAVQAVHPPVTKWQSRQYTTQMDQPSALRNSTKDLKSEVKCERKCATNDLKSERKCERRPQP